jgi:rhodanese-related sulfurtransferase
MPTPHFDLTHLLMRRSHQQLQITSLGWRVNRSNLQWSLHQVRRQRRQHMTTATVDAPATAHPLLLRAAEAASTTGLSYAGSVPPRDAWAVVQAGAALLVDVRSAEERHFVGHVPGSVHVPWATGTALTRNPRFVKELRTRAGDDKPLLLLCRSGKRSAAAAEAATQAGMSHIYNVLEGFEGDHDDTRQRGHFNGWRFHGLPWSQD